MIPKSKIYGWRVFLSLDLMTGDEVVIAFERKKLSKQEKSR